MLMTCRYTRHCNAKLGHLELPRKSPSNSWQLSGHTLDLHNVHWLLQTIQGTARQTLKPFQNAPAELQAALGNSPRITGQLQSDNWPDVKLWAPALCHVHPPGSCSACVVCSSYNCLPTFRHPLMACLSLLNWRWPAHGGICGLCWLARLLAARWLVACWLSGWWQTVYLLVAGLLVAGSWHDGCQAGCSWLAGWLLALPNRKGVENTSFSGNS